MKNKSKRRISVEKKFLYGLLGLAFILTLSISIVVTTYVRKMTMEKYHYDGFSITRSTANIINGDLVQNYMITKEPDAHYYFIYEYMKIIKAEFSDVRYFYVIVPGIDGLSYIWETTNDPDTTDIIGYRTPYATMEAGEDMVKSAFRKNPEEHLIEYVDPNFGTLVTAASPVFDSSGKPVALVCVDLSKTAIEVKVIRIVFTVVGLVMLIMIISSIIHYISMRETIIKPIKILTKASSDIVNNIESGQEYKSEIHSGDEIEDLSKSFEEMDKEIRAYIEENAKITSEKERIGAELDMAKSIQASQLPSIFPAFPGKSEFDIFASMKPAKEVGGDFYDFFMVDDDHIVLVMADVSGKGIPAALFMMISKILIKNHMQNGSSPGETLEAVNNQLLEGNKEGLFVTVWMAIIEISTGKGVAVNAGHEHPALKRKGQKYELVKYRHSPAVSTIENMIYKEHEFELNPGDSLFVYTDGVAEATNKELELFGTDRMIDALNSSLGATPQNVLGNVMTHINKFVGDAEQFDDITMLCFEYKGKKE